MNKRLKEYFTYDGKIPIEKLMSVLTDVWQDYNGNSLFRESSHYEDEARDEDKYIEISSIVSFYVPSSTGFQFSNKRVEKAYDEEINDIYDKFGMEDGEFHNALTEYEPILFLISIDLKEKIIYADVDLGNRLGSFEVARERLSDNENDFRKQIERMIDAF